MFCFSDEKYFEVHLKDGIIQKFEVVEYDRKIFVLKLLDDYQRLKNVLESWLVESKGTTEEEYQCWIGNIVNSSQDGFNDGLSEFKQNFEGNKEWELDQSSSLFDKFCGFANEIKEHGENNNQTHFLNDNDVCMSEQKLYEANNVVGEKILGDEEEQLSIEVEGDENVFLKKKEKNKRKRDKRKKKELEVLHKVEDIGPCILRCLENDTYANEYQCFWGMKEQEFNDIRSQLKKGQVLVSDGKRYGITKVDYGIYHGQINDDNEPDGYGEFQFNDVVFFGNFKNGINGIGTSRDITCPRGNRYIGDRYFGMFKNGNSNGKGILLLNNQEYNKEKQRYNGEFENGKIHGKGKMYLTDGTICEGNWDNGSKNGKFEVQFKNGNKFVGIFNKDIPADKAKLVYKDGSEYTGGQKQYYRNGKGKFTDTSGDTYEGYWLNDKKNGHGVWITEYCRYEGKWKNDKMDGIGHLSDYDGNEYFGDFKDNYRHGIGKKTNVDEYTYEGSWVYDRKEGNGQAFYSDGSKYSGNWSADKRYGEGQMNYNHGGIYKGNWIHDEPRGNGMWKTQKGTRIGYFEQNGLDGDGTHILPNGCELKGTWKNGHLLDAKQVMLDEFTKYLDIEDGKIDKTNLTEFEMKSQEQYFI